MKKWELGATRGVAGPMTAAERVAVRESKGGPALQWSLQTRAQRTYILFDPARCPEPNETPARSAGGYVIMKYEYRIK